MTLQPPHARELEAQDKQVPNPLDLALQLDGDADPVIDIGRQRATLGPGQHQEPAAGDRIDRDEHRWNLADQTQIGAGLFKLVMAAAKTWRRLKGENQLPKLIQGVTFKNGVEVTNTPAQHAA